MIMESKTNNTAAEYIGKRLKLLRIEREMTATEVCEKAGIGRPTLTAIEGGYYNTGIRLINDVAKAVGAHIEVVAD